MSADLDVYMLFFVALGMVALSFNGYLIKNIYSHLDDLTEELEDV